MKKNYNGKALTIALYAVAIMLAGSIFLPGSAHAASKTIKVKAKNGCSLTLSDGTNAIATKSVKKGYSVSLDEVANSSNYAKALNYAWSKKYNSKETKKALTNAKKYSKKESMPETHKVYKLMRKGKVVGIAWKKAAPPKETSITESVTKASDEIKSVPVVEEEGLLVVSLRNVRTATYLSVTDETGCIVQATRSPRDMSVSLPAGTYKVCVKAGDESITLTEEVLSNTSTYCDIPVMGLELPEPIIVETDDLTEFEY